MRILAETVQVGIGEAGRHSCRLGCGARPKIEDALDHLEICPLAFVACLLEAHGCKWKGPRAQRRRHLVTCPKWQIKCPVCSLAVHIRDFSGHVLGHSAARDHAALHPTGCALREYGCRACRGTTTKFPTTAIVTENCGDGGYGDGATTSELQDHNRCTIGVVSDSYEVAVASAAATVAEIVLQVAAETAAEAAEGAAEATGEAQAAMAAMGRTEELNSTEKEWVRGETDDEWGDQDRGRGLGNAGICRWYQVVCKSCEHEVMRKEWDAGEHFCPIQRRVNVFPERALGAGKPQNGQRVP